MTNLSMQTSKEKLDVLICKKRAVHRVNNTFLRENQTDESKYSQASLIKKKKELLSRIKICCICVRTQNFSFLTHLGSQKVRLGEFCSYTLFCAGNQHKHRRNLECV